MKLSHREVTRLGRDLASRSHGVISRRDLNQAGIDRYDVRTQVRSERWIPLGPQALRVLDAPWDDGLSPIIAATHNAGPRAWADGASALLLAGLQGWRAHEIDVSLPLTAPSRRPHGVRTRRLSLIPPLARHPVPYGHPSIAALRAAAWTDTPRQAAALLSMPVQQRLVRPNELSEGLDLLPRLPRRSFITGLVHDIAGGSESIGELDFLKECRKREIPPPDRQTLKHGQHGRMYLDALWDHARLCVEIDGAHHFVGETPIKDSLRQNELVLLGTASFAYRASHSALTQSPSLTKFGDISKHIFGSERDAGVPLRPKDQRRPPDRAAKYSL